jgi:hypothetical protein
VRPVNKAHNLTAICETIVYKMWEPRRPITLWPITACYRIVSLYLLPYRTGYEDMGLIRLDL